METTGRQFTEVDARALMKEIFDKGLRSGPVVSAFYAESREEAMRKRDELVAAWNRHAGRELAAKMNRWFGLPRIVPSSCFFRTK